MKSKFNHLKRYYSDFNLSFLNFFSDKLHSKMIVADIGCGHMRNLRLLNRIGFNYLVGIDKTIPKPTFDYQSQNIAFIQSNILNGIPLPNDFSDLTLCNYVLMFIEPSNINFVLDELYRISNKYLVIETYKLHANAIQNQKGTDFKDYSFSYIVEYLVKYKNMKIIYQKSAEKVVFMR